MRVWSTGLKCPTPGSARSLMVESFSPASHIVQQGVRVEGTSKNSCDCQAYLRAFPSGDRSSRTQSRRYRYSQMKSCVCLGRKLCTTYSVWAPGGWVTMVSCFAFVCPRSLPPVPAHLPVASCSNVTRPVARRMPASRGIFRDQSVGFSSFESKGLVYTTAMETPDGVNSKFS